MDATRRAREDQIGEPGSVLALRLCLDLLDHSTGISANLCENLASLFSFAAKTRNRGD
jgi:hypothetical protein